MFGLSKRSTRLDSCCCAQLVEKPSQVKQIVGNQRTPVKLVKRRFPCKANYRQPTIQPPYPIFDSNGSAAKSCTQIRAAWRCRDATVQNVVSRNRAPIVPFVRALARPDHSAFQRSADKKTFRFAVGINGRSRCHVGLGSAPDRPRCNARISAEGHISALRKSANSAFVVKHDDKIGHLSADLGSPTRAAGSDERRA